MRMIFAFVALSVSFSSYGLTVPPQVRPSPLTAEGNVVTALEEAVGDRLSEEQKQQIQLQIENYETKMTQPTKVGFDLLFGDDIFGREQHRITALFCVGVSVSFAVKGEIAACSTLLGNVYFTRTFGLLASGAKAPAISILSLGASVEAFTFVVNHRKNDPIEPQFTMVLGGGSTLALIGPKGYLFHSVMGNQGGVLLGIKIGRMSEVAVMSLATLIYDQYSDLQADILKGVITIDKPQREERLKQRRARFSMN